MRGIVSLLDERNFNMGLKSNHSIYFKDTKGEQYFLFQVLNLGKEKDELKFVFNDPDFVTAVKYSEIKGRADKSDIIMSRNFLSQ